MGLLENIKTMSNLGFGGKTPKSYDITTSQLNPKSLEGSTLDLDGKTPKKYMDNPPK